MDKPERLVPRCVAMLPPSTGAVKGITCFEGRLFLACENGVWEIDWNQDADMLRLIRIDVAGFI